MNITAPTTNRYAIQEFLKNFEKNKNARKGITILQSALEEMEIVRKETKDIKELWFINNSYCTYRNVVIEMSRKVACNGTPSLDDLGDLFLCADLMQLFEEYKFDDDRDFKNAYTRIKEKKKKFIYELMMALGHSKEKAAQVSKSI